MPAPTPVSRDCAGAPDGFGVPAGAPDRFGVPAGVRAGRVDSAVFSDLPGLADWRVFICGSPPMVEKAKNTAYLAGAAIADIHADPFELRDLRRKPRPGTPS